MLSLASTLCEADEAANTRITERVFTYTPNETYVINVEKKAKVKWYKKGAKHVKRFFKDA